MSDRVMLSVGAVSLLAVCAAAAHMHEAELSAAPPWLDGPDFPQALQEKAFTATLRLTNPKEDIEGSAVRVRCQGPFVYYLTAEHLVRRTPHVTLDAFTAASTLVSESTFNEAEVVAKWPAIDVAVLRTKSPAAPCVELCPKDKMPRVGDKGLLVLTVGCTDGASPELLAERIGPAKLIHKSTRRDSPGELAWQTNRPGVKGRSGGPMVDPQGFLIGICSGTDGKNGYYVHLDEIRKSIEKSDLRREFADGLASQAADPVKK